MVMHLPEYSIKKPSSKDKSSYPPLKYTVCRIVFRTPVTNLRSDINGLDLYTSSVLGVDRYEIANRFFIELQKRL